MVQRILDFIGRSKKSLGSEINDRAVRAVLSLGHADHQVRLQAIHQIYGDASFSRRELREVERFAASDDLEYVHLGAAYYLLEWTHVSIESAIPRSSDARLLASAPPDAWAKQLWIGSDYVLWEIAGRNRLPRPQLSALITTEVECLADIRLLAGVLGGFDEHCEIFDQVENALQTRLEFTPEETAFAESIIRRHGISGYGMAGSCLHVLRASWPKDVFQGWGRGSLGEPDLRECARPTELLSPRIPQPSLSPRRRRFRQGLGRWGSLV